MQQPEWENWYIMDNNVDLDDQVMLGQGLHDYIEWENEPYDVLDAYSGVGFDNHGILAVDWEDWQEEQLEEQ